MSNWARSLRYNAKRDGRLPVVLPEAQVQAVLRRISGVNGLLTRLLYGSGIAVDGGRAPAGKGCEGPVRMGREIIHGDRVVLAFLLASEPATDRLAIIYQSSNRGYALIQMVTGADRLIHSHSWKTTVAKRLLRLQELK